MVYEIRLRGRAGRTIATAFEEFDVSTTERETVLRGEVVDQPALFGVLDRIQGLGLDLVGLQAVDPA